MTLKYNLSRTYGGAAALCKAFVFMAALLCAAASGAQERPLRVLAFGDSLTQGYGLIEENGFVPQMQDWLDAKDARVTVVNGGVSGDTTDGGAARIGWSLTPDIGAMILALGANDMLRGLDPAQAKANLEQIIEAAEEEGVPVLLVGIIAPNNYGAGYKAAFDGLYTDLAEKHGLIFAPDFLGALKDAPEPLLDYMQPDGIHPDAQGVRRIVDSLGPLVLELVDRAQVSE